MKLGPTRATVTAATLKAPSCPIARPGDLVIWYQNTLRQRGTLLGHTPYGTGLVAPDDGGAHSKVPYDSFRLAEPEAAVGPIWAGLSHPGAILQATEEDLKAVQALMGSMVPPGIRHSDLTTEIWLHGFEVFLSGAALRNVLTGETTLDAELVTTMPYDRLERLVLSMYGEQNVASGDLLARAGRLRVGGRTGTADPAADIRMFRFDKPGSPTALFGADFRRDMDYGDFTCHSVYYEPSNAVFIDPCGTALEDVEQRCLTPNFEPKRLSPREQAVIGLRALSLKLSGYSLSEKGEAFFAELDESLAALSHVDRAAEIKEALGGGGRVLSDEVWQGVREVFVDLGHEHVWHKYFAPCRDMLS
ncbi:hypothetical protein EV652_107303 [Kribbella steppae]|uniref:Uncharacterized protein n=1 Tax=Kribbella steppae TaxID=2512223 RepID=A0A4R2HDK3_9ACTN|nr:hypothetical protein [Kribbella steppae]TCO26411.1 hypothetical protein EV652_107303 [Kribbella steppae]